MAAGKDIDGVSHTIAVLAAVDAGAFVGGAPQGAAPHERPDYPRDEQVGVAHGLSFVHPRTSIGGRPLACSARASDASDHVGPRKGSPKPSRRNCSTLA